MTLSLLVLCHLAASEPIYPIIKEELETNPTPEKDRTAILWALALLADRLDRTVTEKDVTSITGAQIENLITRFEITDAQVQADLDAMHVQFRKTRDEIFAMVESSKTHIQEDMEYHKNVIIGHVMEAVENSREARDRYLTNAHSILHRFFTLAKNVLFTHAILFFVFFQILLLFGIVFYRKLSRQLRMLL
jgi:hypothetical protein